jgi:hypothetical protein
VIDTPFFVGSPRRVRFWVRYLTGRTIFSSTEVTIDIDFNVSYEDARTIAQDQADALLEECGNELDGQAQLDSLATVEALSDCMERKVNETLAKHQEEQDFQAQLRQKMASELVPYACGDLSFNTSAEFINRTWYYEDDVKKTKRNYQMQVLHEHASSSIFQVPDFTTPEECNALRFFVEDTHIPFSAVKDRTKQGILVLSLATRLYQLTQAAMGWEDLSFQSQSDEFDVNFLEIFKDTVGVTVLRQCTQEDLDESNQNDRDNDPLACRLPGAMREKVPTRRFFVNDPSHVATVFLYCNQEENRQLGGLHFPNAAVHVNSQPNLLVVAQHQSIHKAGLDGYTDDYHFCPNYDVMTHTFHSKNFVEKTAKIERNEETDTTPMNDEL